MPAGVVAVSAGLRAVVVMFLPAAVLTGADVTRVAVVLPLDAVTLEVTLLPDAVSALLTLLAFPAPPLTDDPLVNTLPDPVCLLPPCQRSSLFTGGAGW